MNTSKKYMRLLVISITSIIFLIIIFIAYFNRAPERIIPDGNVIVSPATGDIIHIEKADTKEISFLKKGIENRLTVQGMEPPFHIVVIEMDPTDEHVQRTPIDGTIIYQEHIPGAHKNALWSENVEELANENEKNIIVMQNDDISVGVIQVAGIMARRIVSYVSPSDALDKGDIYGRIKLGSQVVLIMPQDINLEVAEGDVLVDGESVVGGY